RPAIHGAMLLGDGNLVRAAGLGQLGSDRVTRAERAPQLVGIVAHAVADAPRAAGWPLLAPVAERETEGIIRLPRLNPGGAFQLPPAQLELHDIAVLNSQLLRRLAADQDHVVPGDLGDRVGELMKPAAVVPAT